MDKIASGSRLLHTEDDKNVLTETKEKTSNSCTIKTGFHGNIPVANTCDIDESIGTDDQEISQSNIEHCDIQVSNEANHLEGEAVLPLSSDVQGSHVYVVSSPIDQHIATEFHSQTNTDENLKIHVEYDYGDMSASHKAIEGYNSGGRL